MGYITQLLLPAKPFLLEALGTFLFVLIGTSVLVSINLSGEGATSSVILMTTLAFSLAFGWLIYLFQRHNNGFFNPAATLLLWSQGQFAISWAAALILMQFIGAIAASTTVALLYGPAAVDVGLGAVYPASSMGPWAALVAEFLGTACLLVCIMRTEVPSVSYEKRGLLVGLSLAIGLLISTGVSGGALNPARALAPQLAAADVRDWWVYVCGPLAAAAAVWCMGRWLRQTDQISSQVAVTQVVETEQDRELSLQQKARAAVAALRRQSSEEESTQTSPESVDLPIAPPVESSPQPEQIVAESSPPQPSFQPEEEKVQVDQSPPPVNQDKAPRTAVPSPSAVVRFVDFDEPQAPEPAQNESEQ